MRPVSARQHRLIFDAVVLGFAGAFAARMFEALLAACTRLMLVDMAGPALQRLGVGTSAASGMLMPHGVWMIPVVTTLGGLISGLLVYSLAPEAEGHGTDTTITAFHRHEGWIRPRVAPLKMLASAITIGSGGAAGREGPAALIASALGSSYARIGRRPAEERRLLLLMGMAAGLAAVFRSPIGTAIFATEVLYSEMEFETRALLYTMLSSIVAYGVNGLYVGWDPLFHVPATVGMETGSTYLWYVLLGVGAGLFGTLIPSVFYRGRDAFHALDLPPHLKPALGGLGVGLLAVFLPQVLGGGYEWVEAAIHGELTLKLLCMLAVAKIAAFVFTVSSGGSGGVFAPTLFVGAMLGAAVAAVAGLPPAAFAVVGMAALFGAAARVPIATVLMVTEMTAGYQLLVPATTAVMIAYIIQSYATRTLRVRYRSLYEGQFAGPADSPAHHAESLRTALSLLDHGSITLSENVGHLNLFPLLDAGVPIDFPDGNCLALAEITGESPCANTRIVERCVFTTHAAGRIVAIRRSGHLLVPDMETRLLPGDQIVFLANRDAVSAVTERCHPASLQREESTRTVESGAGR